MIKVLATLAIVLIAKAPEMMVSAKSKTRTLLTTSSYSWSDVQPTSWPVYQPSPSSDEFVPSFGVLTEADRKSSKSKKSKKQKTTTKKPKKSKSKGNSKGASNDSPKENKPEPFVPSFGVLTEADRKPAENKPAETPKNTDIDDDLDLTPIG